jgi:hypothetical protein
LDLNKTNYLVLALIAKRYLQIPATSTPSEQYFSQRALNLVKLRNKITKETFNKIMCLRS